MWVSLINGRLMGAVWGQWWDYWFSPYRAIDEQHAHLAIIDLIPEEVKESLKQIFEFAVIPHSPFFLFVTPFTSIRCIFILLIIPAVGSVCLAARPTQRFNAKNT